LSPDCRSWRVGFAPEFLTISPPKWLKPQTSFRGVNYFTPLLGENGASCSREAAVVVAGWVTAQWTHARSVPSVLWRVGVVARRW